MYRKLNVLALIALSAMMTACGEARKEVAHQVYTEIYSDDDKLTAEGLLVDSIQDGVWKFYNEQGEITMTGAYDDGLMVGEWKYYDFIGNVSRISWAVQNGSTDDDVAFSIPAGFKVTSLDKGLFMAVDSVTSDVFTFRKVPTVGVKSIEESISLGIENEGGEVQSVSRKKVASSDGVYFYESWNISMKEGEADIVTHLIIKEGKELDLIWSYTCFPEDAATAYFLIGEVFHHTFYRDDIVQKPFLEIEVTEMGAEDL